MPQRYIIVCILLLHCNFKIATIHAQGQTCLQPQAPDNGFISSHDGSAGQGTVVYFQCNDGYQLQGDSSATCVCYADACLWSVKPPVCVAESIEAGDCPFAVESDCNCGNPGTPINGCSRIMTSNDFGCTVEFSCKPGYRREGPRQWRCNILGSQEMRTTCVENSCNPPRQPRNGWYETTNERFFHGTVLSFRCHPGHVMIGSQTRTCENGRWSGEYTACTAVRCNHPGTPHGGDIDGDLSFGGEVTFSCRSGFRLDGPRSIRCQDDRTWSEGIPQCNRVYCENPGVPTNGEVVRYSRVPTYQAGSFLDFVCDRKYNLVGSSRITCQDNGEWNAPVPNCEIVTCSVEDGAEHLTFEASEAQVEDGYLVDARLDFSCDTGYRVVGATSVQCTRSGDWTNDFPFCQIKSCAVATAPANGGRRGDVFTYGSVVSFYCNDGYALNGNTHLSCGATGQWNGTLPSCTDEGCGVPDSPERGSVQFHGVTIGSISIFSCDQGYRLIGESVATCTINGWDSDVPRCREIQCSNPGPIPNGRREGNSFTVGSEMRYFCDQDHTLVGSSVSVCTTSGTWSHPTPTCQAGECTPLSDPDHGTTTAVSLTHGSWVEFTCFKGYSLSGSARTQCNADGSWSNPVPTCNACGIGLHKEEVDRRDCTLCPAGSTTTTAASTSRLQCVCQEGTTGPAGGPCTTVRCDIPNPPDNGLIAECNTNLNGRCSVECLPGYVVRGTRVRTCLNNFWLPENNLPTCHACPVDTYSTGGDRTSCELCPVHSHTAGSTGVTSVNGCVCLPGFRRYHFGGPCQDVDECQLNNGGCTGEGADCHNTDGSRTCRCSILGYTLDDSGMNCIRERGCEELSDGPENGRLLCTDNTDYNSRRCNIICNDGYYFVSGNSYLTCGPTSNWIYSHQRRNRTATIPGCTEEFFIDTLFNLTVTLEVPANCNSYTGNLPSDYFINTVLQERGDCSDYQCAANQNEISLSCSDTGSDPGMSELTLHFTVYLENPEDESVGENCLQNCQLLQLRSIIQATGQIWVRHQQVFTGELGQVETNSGRLITLSGGEVEASRPDVRCHEEGRVFTDQKLCVPCSKGYYLPGRTEESCHPCPEGTYQDETGQTSCIPCPEDLTTLEAGSSSVGMCVTQERVDIIMAGLQDDNILVRE